MKINPLSEAEIAAKLQKLVPVSIDVDLSHLDDSQKKGLQYLVNAAGVMDRLFFEQVYDGNLELRTAISKLEPKVAGNLQEYFNINFGPFDRLDHQTSFLGKNHSPPKRLVGY